MPSEDYSGSVKLNISGASESFVAWLLADLLHLIGGGIVGSMPLESHAATGGGFIPGGRRSRVLSHSHSGTLDIRTAVRCGRAR